MVNYLDKIRKEDLGSFDKKTMQRLAKELGTSVRVIEKAMQLSTQNKDSIKQNVIRIKSQGGNARPGSDTQSRILNKILRRELSQEAKDRAFNRIQAKQAQKNNRDPNDAIEVAKERLKIEQERLEMERKSHNRAFSEEHDATQAVEEANRIINERRRQTAPSGGAEKEEAEAESDLAKANERLAAAQEAANKIAEKEAEAAKETADAEENEANTDEEKEKDEERWHKKALKAGKSKAKQGGFWAAKKGFEGLDSASKKNTLIWTLFFLGYDIYVKFYLNNGSSAFTFVFDLVILFMMWTMWGARPGLLFVALFELTHPTIISSISQTPLIGDSLPSVIIQKYVNSAVIPMWAIYVGWVTNKGVGLTNTLIKVAFTIYLMSVVIVIAAAVTGSDEPFEFVQNAAYTAEQRQLIIEGTEEAKGQAGEFFGQIAKGFNPINWLFPPTAYQYNVQYTGDPERSEPVGIVLAPSDFNNDQYRDDADITVYGKVSSLSPLEEPVFIPQEAINCRIGQEPGTYVGGDISVNYGDEKHLPCVLTNNTIKSVGPGFHKVVFEIDTYTFDSVANLRTAFMDIDTLREHKRDNIDPYTRFDIPKEDQGLQATYTNGPAAIEFNTQTPPLGIKESVQEPTSVGYGGDIEIGDLAPFNIQISKNERLRAEGVTTSWKGSIERLNSLTVYLPKGLKFAAASGTSSPEQLTCDFLESPSKSKPDQGITAYEIKSHLTNIVELDGEKTSKFTCFIYANSISQALDNKPILIKNIDVETSYEVFLRTEFSVNIIS